MDNTRPGTTVVHRLSDSSKTGSGSTGGDTETLPGATALRRNTLETRKSSTKHPDSREVVHRINAPGSVQALVIDDDLLIAGLQGGDLIVWSLETYEQLLRLKAHQESVLGLSLSEDKSLLLSTGADSLINIWSTQTFEQLYSLRSQHEVGDIFCAAFSDRKRLVFCGAQNASIQWHALLADNVPQSPVAQTGARRHRFFDSIDLSGKPSAGASQLDTANASAATSGRAISFSSSNYAPYAHKSYIYTMVLAKGLLQKDPEEEVLITGGGGGTIKVWGIGDLPTHGLVPLAKFKNKDHGVLSLCCKGYFLYAGLSNGFVHVYNLASRQLVQRLQVGHGDVSQIQVFDGSIMCGTSQGIVRQFNQKFVVINTWSGHEGKILATGISQNQNRVVFVTGGNDNKISLWDVTKQNEDTHSTLWSNDELVDSLREFVAYRSVSSNTGCVSDCHEAANFLRKICNLFGATTQMLSPQEGVNPILIAKFAASNKPQSKKTVLFYGHYDVVDADSLFSSSNATWRSDPFKLHPLNGFLYGRGVSDNKGPILAALYAVADLVQNAMLSCNVTFLLEGDEEAGSRGFRKCIQDNHAEIAPVDFVLLSNSYWLDDHIPCLTFGMRGVVHATISVSSNKSDLHSGMDGKPLQHEPLKDLTVLLAMLIGSSGLDTRIPNFFDSVDKLQQSEHRAYTSITTALMPGHPEIKDEKGFTDSLMQRWREPNLTIHRIEVPESKTAVTISSAARATLSIRIVPSQKADQIASSLRGYLEAQFRAIGSPCRLSVDITSKADPWLGKIRSPLYEALLAAVTSVWSSEALPSSLQGLPRTETSEESREIPQQLPSHRRGSTLASRGTFTADYVPKEPLFIREGGSIPAISFLEAEFNAPAAMFPMGQASDNAHLDNERMRIENLYKGREVLKRVFSHLE